MRTNVELVVLFAVLAGTPRVGADDVPRTTPREQAALRARTETVLATALSFRPRLASLRTLEVGASSVVIGVVEGDQAARVACSDLAREPLDRCSVASDEAGVAAFVVLRPESERAVVGTLVDEGTIVDVRILDATVLEADGDEAREFALSVAMSRDEVSTEGIVVLDDDGRVLLDEDVVTCEEMMDEGPDCTDGFVAIADDDGDGRSEIVVVSGANSDAEIADLVLEVLRAGDEAENSSLYEVERRTFTYDVASREYQAAD